MSTTGTLRVHGANIYYMVRGSGPVLLLIQGGAGDADAANGLVDCLIHSYTVVTYDRRGQYRSIVDNPSQEMRIETESDDAHDLLATLSAGPAYVFGSSLGAVIALDLATRRPDRVQMVIAHEPPAPYLLDKVEAHPENFREIYRREGAASALQQFAASVGVNYDGSEPGVEPRTRTRQAEANARFFFEREAPMLRSYRLDIAALQAAPTRIVLAGGETGREHWPYRCAVVIAELLGTKLLEFPGHHAGYVTYPETFAARLREALGNG